MNSLLSRERARRQNNAAYVLYLKVNNQHSRSHGEEVRGEVLPADDVALSLGGQFNEILIDFFMGFPT